MQKYRLISKKGEGTFSEVLKAQSIKDGRCTAIKCMKSQFESAEQVNHLREIQALRRLSPHPHIIKLIEVLFDQPSGRLALVFELMDMNIYELIRGRRHYLPEHRIRNYMYQLLKSMDHMHRNGIFHRDIKPENILILDDQLKLADFGSCRGIYSKQPYTEYISTRWYRAPECLLTDGYYNYKMDMWGVGCVFFEVMSLYPLFPGSNELDQINKIHKVLGTPPAEVLAKFKRHASHVDFNFPHQEGTGIAKLIPHASPEAIDLMQKLLCYNPDDRISARQALRHPYFRDLREAEKVPRSPVAPDTTPQREREDRTSLPPAVKRDEEKHANGVEKDNAKGTLPSIHKIDLTDNAVTHNDDVSGDDGEQQLPPIRLGMANQSIDAKQAGGGARLPNVGGGTGSMKNTKNKNQAKKYKQPAQIKATFPGMDERTAEPEWQSSSKITAKNNTHGAKKYNFAKRRY